MAAPRARAEPRQARPCPGVAPEPPPAWEMVFTNTPDNPAWAGPFPRVGGLIVRVPAVTALSSAEVPCVRRVGRPRRAGPSSPPSADRKELPPV